MTNKKRKNNFVYSRNYQNFPMINGQALGDVSKMKYGICPMSFNGCEVIAVYNALVFLNTPYPIEIIAEFMEKYKVLMGLFGGNVYKIGKVLGHYGAEYQKSKDLKNAKAFIVSFWTGKPFLSSIHTVFCTVSFEGIKVYNQYNNCPNVRIYTDIHGIIGKRKPISAYILKKEK